MIFKTALPALLTTVALGMGRAAFAKTGPAGIKVVTMDVPPANAKQQRAWE